ncbi:S9 family peptidase [Saccharothrix lopnurensis]|uniref:S9 family peptidase n=1 Tax=Saccharothrix lopnurensis TaxID=1670621 RepID=A0ABW1PAV0_9PSEU
MSIDATSRAPLRHLLLEGERNTWPRLSPDGRSVVFVHTTDAGPELWLHGANGARRHLISHHGETIGDLRWTPDASALLYRHAPRGRERWALSHLRAPDLTPSPLVEDGSVIEYWLSRTAPGVVVHSSRTAAGVGLFRTNLDGGTERLGDQAGFHRLLVDGDLRWRGGVRLAEDGSVRVLLGPDADSAREVLAIGVEGAADLSVQGFSHDGRRLYLLTSDGAATRRLLSVDVGTGEVSTVFAHPGLDVESYPIAGEGVWFDPVGGEPDVCAVLGQRLGYHALTPGPEPVLAGLTADPDVPGVIIDRSADDRTWLVVDVHDDAPIEYRLLATGTGVSTPLFANRPELLGRPLARLEDFGFTARDGMPVPGYAMRPRHGEPPFPTVVLVHGGPAGRDWWRFHAEAQFLAELGYLSLHVNYRGSRGFGKAFRTAGDGEWGGKMQQDLYDAVEEGVRRGLVAPDRVAFHGSSYGGYAALLAACTRPDLVRCAIAISAPCDLVALTAEPPPYWQALAVRLRHQVLQPHQGPPLDAEELRSRSPAHVLGPDCAPLLVAHGVRDPRVAAAGVDEFVSRARGFDVPVRHLRFADEGHHVRANANRRVLFAEIEEFLEVHLADH